MKIGILTFHCAHNYGAVLQAYALKIAVTRLGHQVDIIDYRPDYLTREYKPFRLIHWLSPNLLKIIPKFIISTYLLPIRVLKYFKYEKCIKELLNPRKIDFNTTDNDYDAFILGSDQIWNPTITKTFDPIFFGNFNITKECKLVSYAASAGIDNFTNAEKKYIEENLEKFHAISVRESSLLKALKNITNQRVYQVVDPTLLLNKNDYYKLKLTRPCNQRYLLVYEVEYNHSTESIAELVAKKYKLNIIKIKANPDRQIHKNNKKVCDPIDYLSYFKYADYVISSSFHGTVFSIIFNKNFYTMKFNNHIDSRTASLLELLELQNRHIDNISKSQIKEIDYSRIDLNKVCEESYDFLTKQL